MMQPTPRTMILIALSAAAALLPACTTTSSIKAGTHASADEPCLLRARLEEYGSLTKDQIVPLLHTTEGRETLARFADEYDTVFYDGNNRYAQIVRTQSSTVIPVLTFYFGWQHPEYTYPRRIMFMENTMADIFDVAFDNDSIRVRVTAKDQEPREYSLDWNPQEMAPWGYIHTRSDRITLND